MSPDDLNAVRLSHELDEWTPAYGGGRGLEVVRSTSIAKGDTANTLLLTLPNHLGTHVDTPAHFFEDGAGLSDYQPDDWLFTRPILVDVDTPSGELIGPEALAEEVPGDADLLLLRTGHGLARHTEAYWREGPGLAPDLGFWLRAERPSIRAVGMDLISVTSRLDRESGRAAHRAFLDPKGQGEPIRLIEDMRLVDCPERVAVVIVAPLALRVADGAPVTVWGFPTWPGSSGTA